MITALLFDMDGVLIDAKEWHYEALNKALRLFGYDISRHEHLVTYDGLPTRQKLKMLTVEQGLPAALHEFINELKQQYTMNCVLSQCKPTFQHEYALSRLKSDGYKIAVCSNSIRASLELMIGKSALLPYCELLLSNEDVTKAKPDPQIYQKAMQQLNVKPNECLIVEDNEKGIEAAKASGGHVMVVRTVNDVTYSRITKRIEECS